MCELCDSSRLAIQTTIVTWIGASGADRGSSDSHGGRSGHDRFDRAAGYRPIGNMITPDAVTGNGLIKRATTGTRKHLAPVGK